MEIAWTLRHLLAIESKSGLKELWGTEDPFAEVQNVVLDGRTRGPRSVGYTTGPGSW